MMILRGESLFFPTMIWGGGCGKFPTKITSSIKGGQPFFGFASFYKYKKTQDSLMLSKS